MDRLWWDTQNGCRIVFPHQIRIWNHKLKRELPTTSLKPTASHLWGEAETNEAKEIADYLRRHKLPSGRWDLMPWDQIGRYATVDAEITLRLYFEQLRRLQDGEAHWLDSRNRRLDWSRAVERRLQTSLMLFRMERRGARRARWRMAVLLA